jgi:hypothetical protein
MRRAACHIVRSVSPVVGMLLIGFTAIASAACEPARLSSDEVELIGVLRNAGVNPLCEGESPKRHDYRLRFTYFLFSAAGSYEYRAEAGRLTVLVDDARFEPGSRYRKPSRVRPASLLRSLEAAGLSRVWDTPDPDCDGEMQVLSEGGSMIELRDADGYHVRWGPRPYLDCTTSYGKLYSEMIAVLAELEQLPPATRGR